MVDKVIIVGRFQGLFGVGGGLKVFSHTRPPANIGLYRPWYVSEADGWTELNPTLVRPHGKTIVAHLGGFDSRDSAAVLIGRDIAIHRSQLPQLEQDEFYWSDLIGLSVLNQQGVVLGQVKEILETGSADVLVVVDGERQHMIPFVRNVYVMAVDPDRGVIEVDWEQDY